MLQAKKSERLYANGRTSLVFLFVYLFIFSLLPSPCFQDIQEGQPPGSDALGDDSGSVKLLPEAVADIYQTVVMPLTKEVSEIEERPAMPASLLLSRHGHVNRVVVRARASGVGRQRQVQVDYLLKRLDGDC